MAFYWGKSSDAMFSCWHSPSSGALVFWLSVLVEWISHARIVRPGINNVVASLMRTVMYAVHITVAYVVMLAVMSFNASVLIAAVAGHAGGFLLFGSRAFRSKSRAMVHQEPSDFSLHRTADGH
ncbi:copper transporter 1-like [Syzygium oleosum]|uniref:copper transporter 1-like n=1 Tax=Syzygium oleosum TaxID=219896 RepID=UPI0011D2654E|nr:copper transporter 1-like [Syzygium oleosum]